MKSKVALAGLLFAAGLLPAQTLPTAKSVEPKTPVTKTPAANTPGTKTSTPVKAAPVAKKVTKEEPMGVIAGKTLARADGTFLGLTLEEGKFKLAFYDKKKKPMKVDVTRAVARWPNVHGPGDNRTVLNVAGDGTYLLGANFVKGPYVFVLKLTLLQGEGEEAKGVENYSLGFQG